MSFVFWRQVSWMSEIKIQPLRGMDNIYTEMINLIFNKSE